MLGLKAYVDIKNQLGETRGVGQSLGKVSGSLATTSDTLTNRLAAIASNLESVNKKLSTRYIGHFPANFDAIIKVLRHSQRTVRIMVDYADYGSLTAYDKFINYVGLVQKLGRRSNVDVRMIAYPLNEARRSIELDFGSREKLASYTNEEAIRSFVKRKNLSALPAPETFMDELIKDQQHVEETLSIAGVRLVYYAHLPLFFWICDEQEAVFSFPLHEDPRDYPKGSEPFRSTEISFYTRESQIVEALCRTFDELYDKASAKTAKA